MNLYLKSSFNKDNYLNLLIALLPFSFIAGNMVININLFLIIISSLFFYRVSIFNVRFFLLDKIIFFYFLLIIFTSFINDYELLNESEWKGVFPSFLKAFYFLRYLLFYFILRFLIEKKTFNFRLFFIFCSSATLFVSIDIFIQFFNGKDLFGYIEKGRKLGGPFGDELIAGGFIQRFSLFSFFLIPTLLLKPKYNADKLIIITVFIIYFASLLMSGNRMPTIIFLFSVLLILIFQKKTRKYLIPFIIGFSLIFITLFKTNETIKINFLDLNAKVSKIMLFAFKKDFYSEKSPDYLKEFTSFYETWRLNKYIGGGIKNFRYYCHHRDKIDKNSDFKCNMHPHNYYLEILTESGIIGFLCILTIFTQIFYLSFVKKYLLKTSFSENTVIIPFIFLFIGEIFPIKSTGSFFTTGNSTYLFLLIGIIVGLIRKDNSIENKY